MNQASELGAAGCGVTAELDEDDDDEGMLDEEVEPLPSCWIGGWTRSSGCLDEDGTLDEDVGFDGFCDGLIDETMSGLELCPTG